MDELLVSVSVARRADSGRLQLVQEVENQHTAPKLQHHFKASSVEEALECLKDEPDYDSLVSVLQYLQSPDASSDIRHPSPLSAQIAHVLVADIVPAYWSLLRDESSDGAGQIKTKKTSCLSLVLRCLRSITGLNAVLARIRASIADSKVDRTKRRGASLALEILVDLLSRLLSGNSSVRWIWKDSVPMNDEESRRRPLSQELVNVVGGGRIVSLAAEAEGISETGSSIKNASWVSESKSYSSWLALNIAQWILDTQSQEEMKLCADLLVKTLQLGYPGKNAPFATAETSANGPKTS